MSLNCNIVSEFIGVLSKKDVAGALDYFTDDAVYINVPIDPPNRGKAAIRAVLDEFMGIAEAMEFNTHHQAETAEGIVLNERTDRFLMGGKWIDLPVMGVFELSNGKIKEWRDYFDLNQFTSKVSG